MSGHWMLSVAYDMQVRLMQVIIVGKWRVKAIEISNMAKPVGGTESNSNVAGFG